jgi:integral membrane protein
VAMSANTSGPSIDVDADPSTPSHRVTSRLGRAFVAVAILEAITWAGLLIGMLLEHVLHVTELGVSVFGPLHGGAFMMYVALTLACAVRFRWSVLLTLVALMAAVPPLATIPMERWLRARGRLSRPLD